MALNTITKPPTRAYALKVSGEDNAANPAPAENTILTLFNAALASAGINGEVVALKPQELGG